MPKPAATSTAPATRTAPGLPRRLIAMVYDTFLVLPLIMLNVAIGMGVHGAIRGSGAEPLHPQLVQLIALLTATGFFSAFWLKSGQTLGMQAWRLKLIDSNGGKPSLWQAVRRCVAALLSAACLGAGYWWCLFDRRGRYWHDYLSGTELILVDKPAKK
ncbi:RDD family protein [Parahaliea mediterranea]|uniref:RDD family protein n=1 Tax=Parahaliea mediterranea TaxID=651086 RepID=A0A939DDX0_9GAMM|nr:RDD family protein [Parahaliea mediterranea]MBN7796309.1 RDD family protein [Parahaliea mediterranea]